MRSAVGSGPGDPAACRACIPRYPLSHGLGLLQTSNGQPRHASIFHQRATQGRQPNCSVPNHAIAYQTTSRATKGHRGGDTMFCLRSVSSLASSLPFAGDADFHQWLGLLVFLSSCSPLYVVLFLATNYWLQRPCVYCSILLFVLCASLIDFKADWFEPRWQPSMESSLSASETLPSFISGNATVTDAVLETASLAISALNGTGGSLVSAAMNSAKRRVGGGASNSSGSATLDFFSVVKSAMEKWQVRIPCLGVVVRL